MKVIAASEIHGLASTSDKDLKVALSHWLSTPPRRIDRLIFQALLGAAAIKEHIRSDCGLYLSTTNHDRPT